MKKKVLISAVSAAVMSLAACGAQQQTPDPDLRLPEEFTAAAVITDGELTAGAELKRLPEGWEVKMTSPERLSGVRFEITAGGCLAGFGDLHCDIAAGTMPDCSPLLMTVRALDSCVTAGNSGTVSGQSYVLTFTDESSAGLTAGEVKAELTDIKFPVK